MCAASSSNIFEVWWDIENKFPKIMLKVDNMKFGISCLLMVISVVGCAGNVQHKTHQSEISSITVKHGPELPMKVINQKRSSPKVMLDVPIIEQKPELKYGCEVTSLAMILQYAGIDVNKMELAKRIPKDNDPVTKSNTGDISHWGNPNHGFVGDITGKSMGYAVYAKPMEALMNRYLPERTLNLTGASFDKLLKQIQYGKPVLVWTTGDFQLPDRWETWKHGTETIKTPLDLHAVVLVGYDETYVYVNDPLTGNKGQKVNKQFFIDSWTALGKQALSYI